MSWQDRLQRAQWRGVSFLTEHHEAKEGRRLAVHELPGADVPVVEDLGAKARSWRVAAYFIGPDYDQARDRFLAALRTPGADWLAHPWLGRLWVRAQDWSTSGSNAEGGLAKVSVEFVEGGAGVPQPQPVLVDVAQEAVRVYALAAVALEPQPMGVGAVGAFVERVAAEVDVLGAWLARSRMPLWMARGVAAQWEGALALWREAREGAGGYARVLGSLGEALERHGGALSAEPGAAAAPLGRASAEAARARVVAAFCKAAQVPGGAAAALGGGALTGADQAALRRNVALEQAARAHWLAAMVMQVALADYGSAAGRDAAVAAVRAVVERALAVSDDAVVRQVDGLADVRFEAAMAARAAVLRALGAQALAPSQWREVVAPMPSVVLAYRMGVDEAVLLARNGVRHPLFVQGVVRV